MTKNTSNSKSSSNLMYWFAITAGLGLVFSWIYWIASGNGVAVFDWLVLGNSNDWELADFYRHIGYGADLSKTYWTSVDACFPPLTYLFFHVLYLINPQIAAVEAAADWKSLATSPFSVMLYVFYIVVVTALWAYLIWSMFHHGPDHSWIMLTLILFFSFPFFCAIERGNPVLVTGLLILAGIYFADSTDKRKRNLAILFFSLAICMKIYPAIFGLYYLKRKRYKEFLMLVILSSVLFFVPFAFTGGIEGFKQFLNVEFFGHYDTNFMREISSIRGVALVAGSRLGFEDGTSKIIGQVLENVFLIASIAAVFITKNRWKEVFFLSAICSFYMPTSWVYSTLYLSAGALCLLQDKLTAYDLMDKAYAVLFGLIFTVPIWFFFIGENPGTWVCLVAYLLWVIALGQCVLKKQ